MNTPYTQVITATGGVWTAGGNAGVLSPDAADLAVARGDSAAFFANRTVGGTRSAVLTTPLAPGLALQVAESLSTTDVEVASVGATLAVLSAIGIMAATVLGWAVARAGLAPVARLAGVAEEVTATGDPGRRVRVERQDELGRLAASFNSMLSALQRSLAAQRRLVSDASHELRTPLASLRVNVELLADDPGLPPAERQEVLNRVVDQVAELSRLVAGVTELARGETPAAGWRRGARSGSTRWPRRPWRRRGGTGRRPSSAQSWIAASWRAAPTGCGWRSGTCWITRRSSARLRGRWTCGWRAGR